jgi:PAS domain S-box-containing protein
LRAEAEEAQQRISRILDSITDALITMDRDFRITYINPEAARINGKPASAFLGRTHWEEWPASVGTEVEHQYRRAMSTGTPVHFKHHYVDENHDLFLEIHAYPTDHGLAIYYRDVTEKEKAQEALLRSEKLAAMGRLAASIAHEINNPLEAVTNLLYLIGTSAISEDVRNYTRLADQELRRVAQIATQTLRFHRQASAPIEVIMSQMLESILVLHQGRLANSGICVEHKLQQTRPVLCLEGEVRQTFTNLVTNAVDAMPFGGRLLIRTKEFHHFGEQKDGVVITIADTGQGMSPAARQRLFEAFFTTKGVTGTGLGLWIAKGIIDKHGGRISVRTSSRPKGGGTVFRIFLPFDAIAGVTTAASA